MDKDQEKYILNAFKKLYPQFPNGEIIFDDKPDVIILSGQEKVGIEITQVFIDSHMETSVNEKRKESLRKSLGNELCSTLVDIIPFKFLLRLEFSLIDFSTADIRNIAKKCAEYLKANPFHLNHLESTSFINWGMLPLEISRIDFFHYSNLKSSCYSETAGGGVPDLTTEHLQPVLYKKDKALNHYKPCDQYWLLIEEGTFYSDSFDEVTIQDVNTKFDKLFIYRHSRGKVVELK